MIIWIVGKSGSGKSYLAKKICADLKKIKKKIFWLDGDKFRKYISPDLKYSKSDRRENSKRIQKFCQYLEKQNINVVCSLSSIFTDHQKKNRKIFKKYFQINVKAKNKLLYLRNNKGIYSKRKDVVGKDIVYPKPYKSDMTIFNDFTNRFLLNSEKIISKIYAKL